MEPTEPHYCKTDCGNFLYDEMYNAETGDEYECSTCDKGHELRYDRPCDDCPDFHYWTTGW